MENNKKNKNLTPVENRDISKADFKFVQMDEKIHDVKFDTKPTTFFKDALKRFIKNKSSVTAGVIIGILILMAIVVPIANTSNIKQSFPQGSFLPPKWPGMDKVNGLNGTKKYANILLDTTDPDNPVPAPDTDTGASTFYPDAIVGEIETSLAYYSTANLYGRGGTLVLRADKRDKGASISTPYAFMNVNNEYNFTLEFDEKTLEFETLPSYSIVMDVKYIASADPVVVTLVDFTNEEADLTSITVTDFGQTIADHRPLESLLVTSFETRFRIILETTSSDVNGGHYPALFMNFFVATNVNNANDDTFTESGINWTSANELVLRDKNLTSTKRWRLYSPTDPLSPPSAPVTLFSGAKTIIDVEVTLGTFVYDEYQKVFGERVQRITKAEFISKYIDTGLVKYDFDIGPTSFEILNDSSPVITVVRQVSSNILGKIIIDLDVEILMYKYYGFETMPYYLFGTNQRGNDFFKVVFSGLSTSLILGVVVAVINIILGMIWGAISGYYGGTVDLIMERFTEILSGVPSIVVFTLTILTLGNSFGVFIMAMILTGWIGIAARTRSQFYRYKRREYVLASRTLGASDGRIIFRHILPNSVGPLITSGVLMIPGIIFTEASIAYLNLGLQGLPSFGVAMSEVQGYIHTDPYLIVAAALIVSLLMVSFNLFGNGLRDAFNPSLKGVE
ncbi:MAG TPA: ABC transporter permease [Bacilli bacterium]|nr:ABC transporter permease [Bacilli bacterium]